MGYDARSCHASAKQISTSKTIYSYCPGKGIIPELSFCMFAFVIFCLAFIALHSWSRLHLCFYFLGSSISLLSDILKNSHFSECLHFMCIFLLANQLDPIILLSQAKRMDVVWGETAGVDGQLWLLCPILFILQVIQANWPFQLIWEFRNLTIAYQVLLGNDHCYKFLLVMICLHHWNFHMTKGLMTKAMFGIEVL